MVYSKVKPLHGAINMGVQIDGSHQRFRAAARNAENNEIDRAAHAFFDDE